MDLKEILNGRVDEDAIAVDEPSATVTYVGFAASGTLDAQVKWKIKRITVTGTVTRIEYPLGSRAYNFQWSLRATYTYL